MAILKIREKVKKSDGTYDIKHKETSADLVIGLLQLLYGYNLLDNSDFLNPVNQRSVSGTISALGYFLDRWKLVSGTVQITAAGIILNGTIAQILERAIGASFTASASGGTASYNDATRTFTLTATGQTITWAKLEKGTTKTPYVPKGYGAELAECKYYFRYIHSVEMTGVAIDKSFATMYLSFGDKMRTTPTITHPGTSRLSNGVIDYEVGNTAHTIFSHTPMQYVVKMYCATQNMIPKEPLWLYGDAGIWASADL